MRKPLPPRVVVVKKCRHCDANATHEHGPFCESCHKKVQDKVVAAIERIGGEL